MCLYFKHWPLRFVPVVYQIYSSIIFYEYYVLITNFITVAAATNTAAAVIFSYFTSTCVLLSQRQ